MRISKKTEYALRVVLFVSKFQGEIVSASEISARQNVPIKFLEQIMRVLKNGGIVVSERGNKGGYLLARKAADVSLFEVVSLFEGETLLSYSNGVAENRESPEAAGEVFKDLWSGLNDYLASELQNISFEDLAQKEKELTSKLAFNFVI